MDRKILLVTDQGNLDDAASILCAGIDGTFKDETLLDMMRRLGDTPNGTATTINALTSLVAQRIKELELEKGSGLVMPTTLMVARTMESGSQNARADDTLHQYQMELEQAPPDERMQKGLRLGDRAMHFAAGWYGSRNLTKIMSPESIQQRSFTMSAKGYEAAQNAARKTNSSSARRIIGTTETLLRRWKEVVNLLRYMTQKSVEGTLT